MNMPERSSPRYQPPPPPLRRKTPSFSSSLLDSILRSIDDQHLHDHDNDLMFLANSEPKRSTKIHLINEQEQIMPSLRRAIMIDQWMETHNNNNRKDNGYVSRKQQQVSSDLSSTTFTTSSSSETETPSTYRSLPNSFTISREAVFLDDTQKASSNKFMKSTKLRAMKIYGDLKKPISPGKRISAFIYSLFASSSSSKKKKAKMEESMHNFRSRSINNNKQAAMTCTSFSRSCMSKKQHTTKRSVRFYPQNDSNVVIHEPKYERRRWFTENNFMVNVEDDDEDEDDLFELEIVGGVGTGAYTQELPVFETTDLRKIRS